ncbi:MAG: prepilin-type N-terminal cleavage/methylation domain-containing protein [Patescibacteria group bacterium]
MKGVKKPLGYTVVEVMIVLAVSGVMFLIAINFISGKQERVSFQQGSNELVSRIQGIVEEVTDGQYTDIPISCGINAGGSLTITGTPSAKQGQNLNCTFLGKMLHFMGGSSTDADSTNYEVFSLAGARLIQTGIDKDKPVASLPDTNMTPIDDNVSSVTGVTLTRQYRIPQGLLIRDTKIVDTNGTPWTGNYAFGFIQGLGTSGVDAVTGVANGTYKSGAQSLSIIFNKIIVARQTQAVAANNIKADSSHTGTAKYVCLAVTDETRWALVRVGSDSSTENGAQLSVSVQPKGVIKDGVPVQC